LKVLSHQNSLRERGREKEREKRESKKEKRGS
jgi:hypothetical protein